MQPCRMAMLLGSMLLASACSPEKPKIEVRTVMVKPTLPPSVRKPCPLSPLPDPVRDLSRSEVLRGWGKDRLELIKCDAKRAGAVDAIDGVAQ